MSVNSVQDNAIQEQRGDEATAWVDGSMLRKDMGSYTRVIVVRGGKIICDSRANNEDGSMTPTPAVISWVGDRLSHKELKEKRGFSAARPVVYNTVSGEIARRDVDVSEEEEAEE